MEKRVVRHVEVVPGSREYRQLLMNYPVYRVKTSPDSGENGTYNIVFVDLNSSEVKELKDKGILIRYITARESRLYRNYSFRANPSIVK